MAIASLLSNNSKVAERQNMNSEPTLSNSQTDW